MVSHSFQGLGILFVCDNVSLLIKKPRFVFIKEQFAEIILNVTVRIYEITNQERAGELTTQVIPCVTFTEDCTCLEFAGAERRLAVFFHFQINFARGKS